MKKSNAWEDEEVKTLFKFIEIKKREGVPLITIFKLYADKVGRMQNSVRNYYYKEVEALNCDKERCKSLGIDIKEHKVLNVKPFSKSDSNKLLAKVNKLRAQGHSVRKSCLMIAEGDATKMIRVQNKYRSLVKEKEKTQMDNIIKMPVKKNVLNDEDVNALFLGLLKLVKKQEFEKAKTVYENDIKSANDKLKDAVAKLIVRENKIDDLKKQLTLLQNQTKLLKEKLENVRIKVSKQNANTLLANYFKSDKRKEVL